MDHLMTKTMKTMSSSETWMATLSTRRTTMGRTSTWIVVVAASLVLAEGKLLLCTVAPTTIISWKRTKRMRIASSADFDLFHGLEDRPLF